MDFLSLLIVFNYGLVLIFGLFLSTHIAGSWNNNREKRIVFAVCPLLLIVQSLFWFIFGVDIAKKVYPLIIHLPLILVLVFALKKKIGVALASVCTAYLCCQIPRWIKFVVIALTSSSLISEISYTIAIFPIYLLLRRYFVKIGHDAMTYSSQTLFLFGSLPLAYYIFDYTAVIYSDALYSGIPALVEFSPTIIIMFYIIFMSLYHKQAQKRIQAELYMSILESELKQSETQLEGLRQIDTQTAIYQHNMRHHLTAIVAYLSSGNIEQAETYIKEVQDDVENITAKRFCGNELVNLLCSSFALKAESHNVLFNVKAKLPPKLSVSDTELCASLSNGLENALNAVSYTRQNDRWINLCCDVVSDKLLIEIKNPYVNEITMKDGLPISKKTGAGHGFGCRSIRSIAQKNGGLCTFDAENGVFTLRFILPLNRGNG